jgi:hypothetical protein
VASIALLDTKSEPAISILPTEDGAGLEVMVMTTSSASETKKVTIANYHVFPLDTNPEFIPVCEPQTLPSLQRGFLAKSGHCVLHCGKVIFVWNTARNL